MSVRNVTVAAPTVDREITVPYDFGDNLDEAVKLFGRNIVFEHFVDNAVIALQGMVRGKLKKDGDDRVTDASIRAAVKNWKPGARVVDPKKRIERVKTDIDKLSTADLKRFQALIAKKLEPAAPKAVPTLVKRVDVVPTVEVPTT